MPKFDAILLFPKPSQSRSYMQLVKGNGATYANSVKLHAVLKFAIRAQITCGAVAKGNRLPLNVFTKAKHFLMTIRNFFLLVLSHFQLQYLLTNNTFKHE